MDKNQYPAESPATGDSGSEQRPAGAEISDQSIRRVLNSYGIGHKLRKLRLCRKVALVDLGKQTGLSASMLSQLENGKLIPTLPTLARIAGVFNIGLEHFFDDKKPLRTFSIVRKHERLRLPDHPENEAPEYFFEVLTVATAERTFSAYLAEFQPLPECRAHKHAHSGSEFLHVLKGTLGIHYQSEEYTLQAGDSVYFDGSEPHSYFGLSGTPAQAIMVTIPPRP